jgi:three-Cys-motif partner protein
MWSAKLVIESTPRWLRNFYLFESEPTQLGLIRDMCDAQPPRNKEKQEPKRKIQIYDGDFNSNITKMFAENPVAEKEATFCLLDQRTFECDWKSVEIVARHKTSGLKSNSFTFSLKAGSIEARLV